MSRNLITGTQPLQWKGVSDHTWSIEAICGLLQAQGSVTKKIDKGLILKALGK